MKSSIAASIVTLSLVAGVGAALAVDAIKDDGPTTAAADPKPRTTPTGTAGGPSGSPTAVKPVVAGPVEPGSVRPVSAGMSVTVAMATGYIERDTGRDAACVGGDFYRWAAPNRKGLDVLTQAGKVISIGISSASYRTTKGIGVGSTLAEVRSAYRGGLIQVVSDYGQAGLLIRQGDDWLGVLFGDSDQNTLDERSKVTFMEVSHGNSPGLLRDGC